MPANAPCVNHITLLRNIDDEGIAETQTVFLQGLNSPFDVSRTAAWAFLIINSNTSTREHIMWLRIWAVYHYHTGVAVIDHGVCARLGVTTEAAI